MPWWNRRRRSRSKPYDPALDSEVGVGWRKRSDAVGEALGGISAELARLPWDWRICPGCGGLGRYLLGAEYATCVDCCGYGTNRGAWITDRAGTHYVRLDDRVHPEGRAASAARYMDAPPTAAVPDSVLYA